jgi:hypothetical protein
MSQPPPEDPICGMARVLLPERGAPDECASTPSHPMATGVVDAGTFSSPIEDVAATVSAVQRPLSPRALPT